MDRDRLLTQIDAGERNGSLTSPGPAGPADANGFGLSSQLKRAQAGRATASSPTTLKALHAAGKKFKTRVQPESAKQFSRLTITEFVKEKFVPEHVAFKGRAGRMHYEAMLKHIITPDEVERAFNAIGGRARSVAPADSNWPYLNDLPLHEIHPSDVQQIISAAMNRNYSMQTITHIRNVISAIFTHARKTNSYSGDNPAKPVRLPEWTRRSTPALTLDQVRNVFELMQYPEREMTLITILTRMNVSEICGLKWKCVNLTGAWSGSDDDAIAPIGIGIRSQCFRGECDAVRTCRNRSLAIPDLLLPILLRLRARPDYTGPEDYVLVSRHGTPINSMNITARRLKPIARKLNMPWLTWSLLRKAHGTLEAEYGAEFEYLLAKMVRSDSL